MKIKKKIQMAWVQTALMKSIESFGQFFFKSHLSKQTPKFHREIFALFQSDKKQIAIAAPRGHAKSTITDLVYLAWVIVNKKAKFVLLVSDTYSQSVLFLETLKAEFEGNEKLRGWYGNLVNTEKWSEGEIIVNGVMVKALGAQMKVRGLKFRESRPDLIIADDLENDELVESLERREKLERWWNGAVVPSLSEDGRIIVIGTILHYDSLLAKMLRHDNYLEYVKRTYRVVQKGEPLWPEHLTMDQIEAKKQEYISKGLGFQFYREYMNDPVSDDNQKFKPEKILFYEPKKLDGRLLATYIAIDRAYSVERTSDFTGIVVVSVNRDNHWYVRIAERFKGNEKELIDRIFELHGYWNPVKMAIEQKAFEHTLKGFLDDEMRRRNQFFKIEQLKDLGKAKNLRIEGLVPRYETGSIHFLPDQLYLREEMERFPRGEKDDLLDALAYILTMAEVPNAPSRAYEDIKQLEGMTYDESY